MGRPDLMLGRPAETEWLLTFYLIYLERYG